MKRSKMVNMINVVLEIETFNSSDNKADYLLNTIENAGMKPPYNDEGLSNYDVAMGSDVNIWEKE